MGVSSKVISVAAIFGALWGVINYLIAPVFFRATRLPFFCDIVGLLALFSAIWVARKFGTGILVGITATVVTLVLRPGAFYFIGFTIASVFIDVLTYIVKYKRVFGSQLYIFVPIIGVVSAFIAGIIIGAFFMGYTTIEAVIWWGILHGVGGLLASIIIVPVIKGLEKRIGPPE